MHDANATEQAPCGWYERQGSFAASVFIVR